MMMMDDAKKKASMIVIGIGGEPQEGDSEMTEMHLEVAQEMMDASKKDDVEGYAYALKTFIMLCEQSEYDD